MTNNLPTAKTLPLILAWLCITTSACTHVRPSNHRFEKAIAQTDEVLETRLTSAVIEAGETHGLRLRAEDVTVSWIEGEIAVVANNPDSVLSDENLSEGILTGLIYVPTELEDGTPEGIYATRVTIAADSNEGTTALIDPEGREVSEWPTQRVIQEGQEPKPHGTPRLVAQGERPRICIGELLETKDKKKTTVESYSYTKTVTRPDGTTVSETDACTKTTSKETENKN